MSKETSWLDKLNECEFEILQVTDILDGYASSFYKIGNEKVANALNRCSERLCKVQKQIDKTSGTIVSEQLKCSQENSAAVFKAALAGCLVARKDLEEKKKEEQNEKGLDKWREILPR